MKKATIKLSALLLLLAGAATEVNAQTTGNQSVVTTAVPFLRISPDARSGAMGETGIATAADANSGFWNLGKTAFAKEKYALGASYIPWFQDLNLKDVYLGSLGGFYKVDDNSAVNLDFKYFSEGVIQFTDANGTNLSSFKAREFSLGLGYSRKLGDKSGIGVGVKYISSDLVGGSVGGVNYKKGSTVAGDLHYFHNGVAEDGSGLNWGVTLSNLGGKVGYTDNADDKDFIPANFGLGASYTKVFDADNKLSFALDLNKLLVPTPPQATDSLGIVNYRKKGVVSSWFSSFSDAGTNDSEIKEVSAGLGAEYMYKDQFAFRAGYFYENPTKGDRRYLTVGAGLKYNVVGLNLAYILSNGSGVNRNPLSNTLRFSLIFTGE